MIVNYQIIFLTIDILIYQFKNIIRNDEKIIVISGKPGLFRMLSQTRTGVIATSLIDGKKTVTNPREQINVLTEIQIYGIKGEVPLEEVFHKIFV